MTNDAKKNDAINSNSWKEQKRPSKVSDQQALAIFLKRFRVSKVIPRSLQVITWVGGWHRSVPVILVGMLAFVGALWFPWLTLPSIESTVVNAGGFLEFEVTNSWVPVLFKLLIALILPLIVIAWLKNKRTLAIKGIWIVFTLSLLFPSVLNYWDTQFKIDSEMIDASMTLLVNEMELQHEMQQSDWRIWQDFSYISPSFVNQVPSVTDWQPQLLLPSNMPLVVSDILGISDSFLTFSAKGWVMVLIACLLCILGFYVTAGQSLATFREGFFFFLKSSALLLLLTQTPGFIAEYYNDHGDYNARIGETSKAIADYHRVEWLKPIYRYNSDFQIKKGRLFKQQGCESCLETYLFEALTSIDDSQFERALFWLTKAQNEYPYNRNVSYRLSGVYNIMAIDGFNDQQYSHANELWWRSLKLAPTMALPWYGLSLTAVHLKRINQASRFSAQIYALQKNMGFKSLVVPAQIHLYHSWFLFVEGDLEAAHEIYSYSKQPESW